MFLVVRRSTVIRGGVRGQKGVESTFRQPQPMKEEQRKSWHEDAMIEKHRLVAKANPLEKGTCFRQLDEFVKVFAYCSVDHRGR